MRRLDTASWHRFQWWIYFKVASPYFYTRVIGAEWLIEVKETHIYNMPTVISISNPDASIPLIFTDAVSVMYTGTTIEQPPPQKPRENLFLSRMHGVNVCIMTIHYVYVYTGLYAYTYMSLCFCEIWMHSYELNRYELRVCMKQIRFTCTYAIYV